MSEGTFSHVAAQMVSLIPQVKKKKQKTLLILSHFIKQPLK